MDKWYTINDLAKMFSVSRQTMSRLLKTGKIDSVNIGTKTRPKWRVYDGALQKFMAEQYEVNRQKLDKETSKRLFEEMQKYLKGIDIED